jgi:rubrerythrin
MGEMAHQEWSLLAAVRLAMGAEEKAEEYYSRAARATVNPLGHRLLKQLAGFEHGHFEQLAALEWTIVVQGGFGGSGTDAAIQAGHGESETISAPQQVPRSAAGVLTMALEIEERAAERYTGMAARTTDPAAREMFRRLAAEEEQHHRALTTAYDNLTAHGTWARSVAGARSST